MADLIGKQFTTKITSAHMDEIRRENWEPPFYHLKPPAHLPDDYSTIFVMHQPPKNAFLSSGDIVTVKVVACRYASESPVWKDDWNLDDTCIYTVQLV